MCMMIDVKNIKKDYPKIEPIVRLIRNPFKKERVIAVRNVSFSVKKGEIFTIMGPNGAGKTTILKILSGLLLPTEGDVIIDNINLAENPVDVRRIVSYVPSEERSLYWRLSVYENLRFYAAIYGVPEEEEKERITEALEVVDLLDRMHDRLDTLSAGLKQRVSIARGLIKNPKVLLMDEPTKGLDPISAMEIRKFTREVLVKKRGITVVWASHDMHEIEYISDRVMLLNKGDVIKITTINNLKRMVPGVKITLVFDGNNDVKDIEREIRNLNGVFSVSISKNRDLWHLEIDGTRSPDMYTSLLKLIVNRNLKVHEFFAEPPSIETAFVHLVERDGNE